MLAMEFCHEWKVYKLVDNHSIVMKSAVVKLKQDPSLI